MKSVLTLGLTLALTALTVSAAREWMILGIDNKVAFTKEGVVKKAPTEDWILIFEIGADPANPRLVKKLALTNSVFGPPTNLAITPDGKLALAANSVKWVEKDGAWDSEPDDLIHVIDLDRDEPAKIGEVRAGRQPSGMAISRDGTFAIVANRAGKSATLLSISGKQVKNVQTIEVDGEAAAVAIRRGGTQALVTKFAEHAVAVLSIADGKMSYDPSQDLAVGRWPYNVQYQSDGAKAYVANNGNSGFPDGHYDTVSVVEIADPPRVIDHITVGDGPEGMTVHPERNFLVVPLLNASAPMFEDKWFYNKEGAIFTYEKTKITATSRQKTGRFPEGVGFNLAGTHLYVGDLIDNQLSVFEVDDDGLRWLKTIPLPGPPVSLRTQVP